MEIVEAEVEVGAIEVVIEVVEAAAVAVAGADLTQAHANRSFPQRHQARLL